MVRWLLENINSLALAFVLSVAVWVVAITEENPSEVRLFDDPIPIEIVGKRNDMVVVGPITTHATVSLRAPRSVWNTLTSDQVRLIADLSGLEAGAHEVEIQPEVTVSTARVVAVSPATLVVTLEALRRREVEIRVQVEGAPAVGYQVGEAVVDPAQATLSGPESLVAQVSELVAVANVDGLKDDLDRVIKLQAVNADGEPLGTSVQVTPASVRVVLPIEQQSGYKDVAVKVIWRGQVAAGYRLTDIKVSPPIVTVFSSEPSAVDALPGFVETEPLDLTARQRDIDVCVDLALPAGVSLVSVRCVSVVIGVAAIESSVTVPREVDVRGLGAGLQATASPGTVDVVLTGALPVLEGLTQDDVRVVIDVTGRGPGTYQLTPEVILLPSDVEASLVLPATIEVIIERKTSNA